MTKQQRREQSNREEYIIGTGKVNLLAFILIIPLTIILLPPFIWFWGYEKFEMGRDIFFEYFIPLVIGGIVVHELLHGVTWAFFAPQGFKSIKFGMHWKYLTPFCHCKEPLKVKHYRIGGAMPLIMMGLIPSLFAYFTGNGVVLSFGIFFTWAAGGDIIALFMLRKFQKEDYINDHPSKIGFYSEL
jgi:hypothetical protein